MDGMAQIQPAQLETIGRSVLEDFLQLAVSRTDSLPIEVGHRGALVRISGSWNGVVEIRVSGGLGERIAGAMFRCKSDAVDEEMLRDALDEVANIVAGNIKAFLPSPSCLSMPEFRTECPPLPHVDAAVRLIDGHGDSLWIGIISLGSY